MGDGRWEMGWKMRDAGDAGESDAEKMSGEDG